MEPWRMIYCDNYFDITCQLKNIYQALRETALTLGVDLLDGQTETGWVAVAISRQVLMRA